MAEKIYIPKSGVRKVEFSNGGSLLRFSVHADTLVKFLLDQIQKGTYVNKGYIAINLSERREPSTYGDTHSASLDTWQPNPKAERTELAVEDIPF